MIKSSFLNYINTFTFTFIVVNSFVTFSKAIEPDELLIRIEKQEKVIIEQRKRIEKLEEVLNKIIDSSNIEGSNIIIKENNLVSKNEDVSIDQDTQEETISNKEGKADQGVLSAKVYNPETAFFGPLPRLKSDNGFFSAGIGGSVQLDSGMYIQENSSNNKDLSDGLRVRRASLNFNGVTYNDWIWWIAYDLEDGGDQPRDGLRGAMAIYRGLKPWWLFAGLFGNSVGLDASGASTQRSFMEPAIPMSTFAYSPGSPAMGIAMTHRGKEHYLRLGIYGEADKVTSEHDEGIGVQGRIIWQPLKGRTNALHIGTTGYIRKPNNESTVCNDTITTDTDCSQYSNGRLSSVRYKSVGETSIDGRDILDTGKISDVSYYWHSGIEAARVFGPLSLQMEYGVVEIDRRISSNPMFEGGYIQGSYFFTGESKNYNSYFGQFWRIKPFKDYTPGKGGGAWEVAARFSYIDLDDLDVLGGKASSYTLGINWYLNSFVKAMLNLNHTESSGSSSEDFDSIISRLQIEF